MNAVFTMCVAQVTSRLDYNRVDAPARPTPTVSPQRPGAQSSLTPAPQPASCRSRVQHDRRGHAVEARAPGQIRSCGARWQSCAQAQLRAASHSERASLSRSAVIAADVSLHRFAGLSDEHVQMTARRRRTLPAYQQTRLPSLLSRRGAGRSCIRSARVLSGPCTLASPAWGS